MPKAPRRPPQLRGRIFRGSVAVSRGLLTRNDLRSSAWRSLFRDVYVDAHLRVTRRDRCGAVIRWLVPGGTAIAGRSAAALYDVGQVSPEEPVDVLMPKPPAELSAPGSEPATDAIGAPISASATPGRTAKRRGPVTGLRVHRAEVDPGDVLDRGGILTTSPARTCWDLARWLDVVEAVVLIDGLLARSSRGWL
ncbi:hypothetical protein ACNAW0_10595 [Micromonospora sp. SL1-18]|uniref:hypothetical protein n=1 Tax=Micromonospora sp. SL1-18 TaxID=3399128 RepID=UPI003A4D773C